MRRAGWLTAKSQRIETGRAAPRTGAGLSGPALAQPRAFSWCRRIKAVTTIVEQDLSYAAGVSGDRVGSSADAIPLPDRSVDFMTLLDDRIEIGQAGALRLGAGLRAVERGVQRPDLRAGDAGVDRVRGRVGAALRRAGTPRRIPHLRGGIRIFKHHRHDGGLVFLHAVGPHRAAQIDGIAPRPRRDDVASHLSATNTMPTSTMSGYASSTRYANMRVTPSRVRVAVKLPARWCLAA